jgi:signal transduction histidine kinase
MKLSLKFALAFLLCMAVFRTGFSYLRFQREAALFDADFRNDHETIGQDLAAAVARLWQVGGQPAALKFVDEANASRSGILIRWVDRQGATAEGPPVGLPPDVLAGLAVRGEIRFEEVENQGHGSLQTYVPVLDDNGAWLGTLQLLESTEKADRYLWTSVVRIVVQTAVIAVATGLLALMLGIWIVGQPVRKLVSRARRIGEGDFAGRLGLRQNDELGELAAEIDNMSDHLVEANRRVSAETAARIEALEQLRHVDRLRTVGQLTSGIAHELGTPLNVVWERAKMIASDPKAPPDLAGSAKVIAEQSQRMTNIIRQLLNFSRPSSPRKVRVDLRQVLRQSIGLLRPTIEGKRVAAALELSEEPVPVDVDVDQIQQVASNLVMNAVQAMPEGGPLTISVGSKTARPPAGGNGAVNCAFFAVRDHGRGISSENLPRVFDPFFTTKDVGDGTGLGLSISLGIVKEHQGWIDVESRAGEGACFTVFLPKGVAT